MIRDILLVKDNCSQCNYVKEKIGDRIEDLEVVNADSPDGMVQMAYHQIYLKMETNKQVTFPFLITEQGEVIHGTIAIKNHILKEKIIVK